MASDVENPTIVYANLPSIFDMESTSNEKIYQPMFGSFLFAESEPFTHAAFVASTSAASIEMKPKEDANEQLDEASTRQTNPIPTNDSSPLALIDIDEDDFDGIPIRHASSMIKDMLNNDIENDHDEDEFFLNGFIDEQDEDRHDDVTTIPSLFNNIPDIDDLNEHLDDEMDECIPFDPLDMLDQSDSIRSSSPDSVLSSSHLRDDDDDEEMNQIDDVTHWNDEDLLSKTTLRIDRPNAPLPPQIISNLDSDNQVNFIDSSRSNSRCSNVSSHLSFGYADQARIFLNDDGLVTSSDSESDHEDENINHWENDRLTHDSGDEEFSLQVNLDYHPSPSMSSTTSRTDSLRSPESPIPDQSPIVPIDEENQQPNTDIPSAPMANADEEDDDDADEDLPIFSSDQPVLSPIPLKNLFQLKNENRQMEIAHDIVNMRHLLDEHENDDEFLAIMHNPTVFEDVLYVDDDQQRSSSTNMQNPFEISPQLSMTNKIESESIKHYEYLQPTSVLSILDNEKNNSSKITTITTTNHRSPTAVNHLRREKEEEITVISTPIVNHSSINSKTTQQSPDKNIANINSRQITDGEDEEQEHEDRYQQMSSDEDSDNDLELFQTLAQLHDIVHPSRLSSSEINGMELFEKRTFLVEEEKSSHLRRNFSEEKKPNILVSNDDNDQNQKKNLEQTSSLTSSSDDILHSDGSSSSLVIMSDLDNLNSELSSTIAPIVERLVSDTLHSAIDQIKHSSYQPIEHFVEQVLSQAVYEIYTENSPITQSSSMDNLLSIINWHYQNHRQLLDPFDQQFDSVWASHFQTPDDLIDPIHPLIAPMTKSDSREYPLTDSVKSIHALSPDVSYQDKNDPSNNNDEKDDQSVDENHTVPEIRTLVSNETETNVDGNVGQPMKRESFFGNKLRLSQFEEFASDQPLNIPGLDPIAAEIHQQMNESSIRGTINDEPWELEENSEENLRPVPTMVTQKHESYSSYLPEENLLASRPSVPLSMTSISISGESDDGENGGRENENHDDHFPHYGMNGNAELNENSLSKTVRFSEKLTNVAMITPKDSLNISESPPPSDSDQIDDDDSDEHETPITKNSHTNQNPFTDQTNHHHPIPEVIMRNAPPRPDSNISITESEDLPPPLPPLPRINDRPTTTDYIPLKSVHASSSSNTDSKNKNISRSGSDRTPTLSTKMDSRLHGKSDGSITRSQDSAILRSTSKDDSNVDSDEVDNVISCMIDNNPIAIDAKTISPFKCVIASAGQIDEENQTAIITLYGCWLPDHRLREYRYIMDQLFYYVYHKLEKLVVNDYVLVYFHGATPKHRTPELKFLRKCYQMINFRLRKNLRAVYVVHPTRWLRTIIALSRPFFSNKFYHKVHYLFTIAELERQFPDNHISIPIIIEQTDWLYSQKYDRQNASIKRSIERSASRLVSGFNDESNV